MGVYYDVLETIVGSPANSYQEMILYSGSVCMAVLSVVIIIMVIYAISRFIR